MAGRTQVPGRGARPVRVHVPLTLEDLRIQDISVRGVLLQVGRTLEPQQRAQGRLGMRWPFCVPWPESQAGGAPPGVHASASGVSCWPTLRSGGRVSQPL